METWLLGSQLIMRASPVLTYTVRRELHSQSLCCLHREEKLIHETVKGGVWGFHCPLPIEHTGWWANPTGTHFHFDSWFCKMGTL